ncbi:MAG: aminoacyl-histidine dipeptidase [Clostridia bacterium]|nr:aminoacyl-histidine dipeptidase [Clostridia bacterium]
MSVLGHLQPERVFAYFEALCGIPHGSGNTRAVSDYCLGVAAELGLEAKQDEANNVLIRKPATPGYESHPPVILQAHLDMVCEKEPGVDFDFTTDPLKLRIEGDWIAAEGTTLGGDDGSGVALALAVLADSTLQHPALEVVLTSDEETGMDGAAALDAGWLTGRRMINLDCGEEGVFTLGCGGGAKAKLTLPLAWAVNTTACWQITVDGLLGGHSGAEIHIGRQNANILMGRLLATLPTGWRLVDIAGGQKDNVITSRCVCTVAAEGSPMAEAAAFAEANRIEADPGLTVTVAAVPVAEMAADEATSANAARLLAALPYGVQAMHPKLDWLVETSLNLGVLSADREGLHVSLSVRSAEKAKKLALLGRLQEIISAHGGSYAESDHYPAWEYQENSPLQQVMLGTYRRFTGKEPVISVTHAGLECGLFSEKLPGLDTVSMGPTQEHIHSPKERLCISSVGRTYAYLCEVLKAL